MQKISYFEITGNYPKQEIEALLMVYVAAWLLLLSVN